MKISKPPKKCWKDSWYLVSARQMQRTLRLVHDSLLPTLLFDLGCFCFSFRHLWSRFSVPFYDFSGHWFSLEKRIRSHWMSLFYKFHHHVSLSPNSKMPKTSTGKNLFLVAFSIAWQYILRPSSFLTHSNIWAWYYYLCLVIRSL